MDAEASERDRPPPAAHAAPDRRRVRARPRTPSAGSAPSRRRTTARPSGRSGARCGGATDAGLERAFAAGSDPAHPRAAADLALRAAGRHPLAAHGDGAARPGRERRPLPAARPGRRHAAAERSGCSSRALRGGNQLTREEAGGGRSSRPASASTGQRLPYILMNAELNALICSGAAARQAAHLRPARGARADARDLPRDEALAELARRYFTSHGPATAKDFATWASLTLAEVRRSVEAAGPALRREELDGLALLVGRRRAGSGRRALRSPRRATWSRATTSTSWATRETKRVLVRPGAAWEPADPPVFNLVVLLDGRVAGFWKRVVQARRGRRRGGAAWNRSAPPRCRPWRPRRRGTVSSLVWRRSSGPWSRRRRPAASGS